MGTVEIILIFFALFIGGLVGYLLRMAIALSKQKSKEIEAQKILLDAKEKAQNIIEEGENKAENLEKEIKEEHRRQMAQIEKTESRLDKKANEIEQKEKDLLSQEKNIEIKKTLLDKKEKDLNEGIDKQEKALERVSGLTTEEAKEQIMSLVEKNYEEDFLTRIQKLEKMNQEKLERRANDIILTSIHRLASSTASDITTTSVSIPSDDIKGKIIGKEGRNIRAFERVAGVELIVDDTPGSLVISSFDPIRRQIARVALENLILDGRIQPAKIEEFVERAKNEISKIIKQKGEEAVYEVGILDLDPRIVAILGRLYFRTSYGQNVLQHSIEMAHIAGMIAEEIGANVSIAKAGALLHDIGKALDHEMQGGHVKIGMRILEKFGADPRIVTAMKSHHDDTPHESTEAVIVQVADMISGGRPGARRDTVENYLKRLEELETVASSFEGVDKVYALSAGREVRIFVHPEKLSDLEAKKLAGDIAKKIETDLRYPGEIKVTLIRENRITEYAR